MTPERWKRINAIYHDAVALDPHERATFLHDACCDDAQLREEVESLIVSHDQAGSFMAEPALTVAARVLAHGQTRSLTGRMVSHYRVEKLLGAGGMGEVYLAEDTKLDRKVAIKLLNEQFSRDEVNLERFVQEAKAASALNHPNILVIHEIGVSDDAHYIVSEFIEGKTLRELLSESLMPVSNVLDLTIQIVNALCTAHEAHLVHRDIKPENIMIRPDGYLKILDFGLAKLVKHGQSEDGSISGTLSYMSPEQARGEPPDVRADLFSVGVMMHEMLLGRTPTTGHSRSERVALLLNANPLPRSRFGRDVPDELQRIIAKALRKDRDERYQTSKELLGDLAGLKDRLALTPYKRLGALALVALLVSTIGLGFYLVGARKTPADRKTSIAVLPLAPVNKQHRNQLYELGITDSLIRKLGVMGFTVRPLSATRHYVDSSRDPRTAGKEQNVEFVLASSYQLKDGKGRITAQLVNVANGQIEETYQGTERDMSNLFATQDAVATEVGNILAARFATKPTGRTVARGTMNEEAYRLYLQGMYLIGKRNPAEVQEAITVLEQAVRLDPTYAQAWAGKANAHLADFSGSPQRQYQQSMEAVRTALALNENLADAHSVLCINKHAYEWDFDGAKRECERAVELDPNSSLAHLNYSRYLMGQGRFEAAIAEAKTAIDLEPTSLASQRTLGMCLYHARRYPEAVTQFKRVAAMDKGFGSPYNWLIVALEMQGNYPEAFESLMRMKAFYKAPEEEIQAYQAAYQTSGWPGVLRERARRNDALSFRAARGGVYFQGAVEQAKVGNTDKAFEYLERSYQTREFWMTLLKVEPGLDSLRQDERFHELVKRVGLRAN